MKKIIKTPTGSESFIAEIVGEESLLGQRMTAGPMLHMMDIAAARYSETPIVTLAFDRIELLDYICHGDYVRYDACVIQVGRSSRLLKLMHILKLLMKWKSDPAIAVLLRWWQLMRIENLLKIFHSLITDHHKILNGRPFLKPDSAFWKTAEK